MSFGTLLFVGVVWFIFNRLRRSGVVTVERGLPKPRAPIPVRREDTRFQVLLQDLSRGLEEAARVKVVAKPSEETPVDQDDQAEQVAARRIAAAEARNRALTEADHRAFDQAVRQPADHTAVATRTFTPEQLRNAVVWREILGPPAALRQD